MWATSSGKPCCVFMLLSVSAERAFGARAVVADQVNDQRVVADLHRSPARRQAWRPERQCVRESREDLLHARVEFLLIGRAGVPGRHRVGTRRQLRVLRDDTELLLVLEGDLALLVPAVVELALILVGPLLGDVVRSVRGARREVDEERLVRGGRLLLSDPARWPCRSWLRKSAMFGSSCGFSTGAVFSIKRRVPLVRLAAEEAPQVLETRVRSASGRTGPAALIS